MGTKRVLDDICFSQSSSDRLAEEAQKHSSHSEGEEICEPLGNPGLTYQVWWARQLQKHARAEKLKAPFESCQEPVTLVSGCSGCCAEAAALKARWWGSGVKTPTRDRITIAHVHVHGTATHTHTHTRNVWLASTVSRCICGIQAMALCSGKV